jgi:hypothetical protein
LGERRELPLALGALRAHARVDRALDGGLRIGARPLGGLSRGGDLAAHLDEILLGGGPGDVGDAGAPGQEDQPDGGEPGDEAASRPPRRRRAISERIA